jgi:ferritin-like metal-binding protein YciE
MIKSAQNLTLKEGFTNHQEETDGQVERLAQVFETIGKRPQGKTFEARRSKASSRSARNFLTTCRSRVRCGTPA